MAMYPQSMAATMPQPLSVSWGPPRSLPMQPLQQAQPPFTPPGSGMLYAGDSQYGAGAGARQMDVLLKPPLLPDLQVAKVEESQRVDEEFTAEVQRETVRLSTQAAILSGPVPNFDYPYNVFLTYGNRTIEYNRAVPVAEVNHGVIVPQEMPADPSMVGVSLFVADEGIRNRNWVQMGPVCPPAPSRRVFTFKDGVAEVKDDQWGQDADTEKFMTPEERHALHEHQAHKEFDRSFLQHGWEADWSTAVDLKGYETAVQGR